MFRDHESRAAYFVVQGWRSWRAGELARKGAALYAGLPRLPAGKRLRRLEHFRRLVLLDSARWQLLTLLRGRFRRALVLEPKPKHGPRCGPGVCPDCLARRRWRDRMAARNGLPSDALIGMTGQRWTPHSQAVLADAELWRQLRSRANDVVAGVRRV